MVSDIPDGRRYTETHEWADGRDGTVRVGVTAFAQDELGEVVFVGLPEVGEDVAAGERLARVESIKAVSDVYAPVSGTVTAVNGTLRERPERVNEDPFGDGWLVELETEDDLGDLLSPSAYAERI